MSGGAPGRQAVGDTSGGVGRVGGASGVETIGFGEVGQLMVGVCDGGVVGRTIAGTLPVGFWPALGDDCHGTDGT